MLLKTATSPGIALVDWYSMYGMGGVATDPGQLTITTRVNKLKGTRIHASPYQYYETNTIAASIIATATTDFIAVCGASLGGNDGPVVAKDLQIMKSPRRVNALYGFQPSNYGVEVLVPDNVDYALCIWNSKWLQTLGLGNEPWKLEPGNIKTVLEHLDVQDFHPGDQDVAMQNVVIADLIRRAKLKGA